jgi:putative tricarboxylic transport membrane protein
MRNPKDFWAGFIYLGFGLTAVLIARDYGMGTTLKMGPGYFPTVLGYLLMTIGAASTGRSFIVYRGAMGSFALKGLFLVALSTFVVGFLIRRAGVAVALPILIVVSAGASVHFRWRSTLALALGLTLFCILVFSKGLGMPLPVLGPWFGG